MLAPVFRKYLRSILYPPVFCFRVGADLSVETEIMRETEREPWHESDDQQPCDEHDEIGQHRARCGLDVATHDRAADIESDPGERHEAADAHGDDQHQRIMQLAEAELAGDRDQ